MEPDTKIALKHIAPIQPQDVAEVADLQEKFGAQVDGRIGHQTWGLISELLYRYDMRVKKQEQRIRDLGEHVADLTDDIERLLRDRRVAIDSLGSTRLVAWILATVVAGVVLGFLVEAVITWN